MTTDIPLIVEGHLFTCTQVGTLTCPILPPKLAECGCDYFLSSGPHSPLARQGPAITPLNNCLNTQSPSSHQLSSQAIFTAPSTPTKKHKGSISPARTPKRKFTNAVSSPNFAVCMVSPEEAARAAGERRRGKATFGSPRPQKRVRLDDEAQSPRPTRQRALRKRVRQTGVPSAAQPNRTQPDACNSMPTLPKQQVEESQALVTLDQVEAGLKHLDNDDFTRLWEAVTCVSTQSW